MEIIGVVDDFHFMSFHSEVEPLAMMYSTSRNAMCNVRFQEGASQQMIPIMRDTWLDFVSDFPFDYNFVSDYYNNLYNKEIRLGQLFIFFSLISIFIAALGIYGLISFLVIKRAREVAVRKINGALFSNILAMYIGELSVMAAFAAFPGMVISSYLMIKWLQGFTYHLEFPWIVLPASFILVWFITVITAFGRSYKAARINPIVMLRRP